MIEVGIHNLVASDAGVSAIVGANVFPVVLPAGTTFPAITYTVLSSVTESDLAGAIGPGFMRIRFDAWSNTYLEAKSIAIALENLLVSYIGTLSDGTKIFDVTQESEQDFFESEARVYRVASDFYFYF